MPQESLCTDLQHCCELCEHGAGPSLTDTTQETAMSTTLVRESAVGRTTFASASDLASALRRAEAAHGEHEKRTGQRDSNWPDWYAAYMVAEQSGTELPT